MRRIPAGIGMAILLSYAWFGHTMSAQSKNTFEIADVHPSLPGAAGGGGFIPGGRLEVRGSTMLELIADAYDTEEQFVTGGPAWLTSDKFDIIAKAPAGKVEQSVLEEMLLNLLIDRFKLVAHKDRRDMPVFVLSVAKGGSKLKKAAKEGPPEISNQPTGQPGLTRLICQSCTMEVLVDLLPERARNFVNHPVVDDTKLKGAFDFQLEWMGINFYRTAKQNPDGPAAVSAFDAVEKLGLKLEPQNRPTPVVVVDSVNETPTPNPPSVAAKIPTFPTEFELAEVRPAKTEPPPNTGPIGQVHSTNGRTEIMGATLKGLIVAAFGTRADRVSGGEKWMLEDRFDIIAKGPAQAPEEAIQVMLKNLLIQRFQLATHTEDRPTDVWVLLAGKKPKLKESDGKARSECNVSNTDHHYLTCTNTTLAQFVERLPGRAGAYIQPPLLDLTELQGAFDFQFYWTPKNQLPGAQGGSAGNDAATPTENTTLYEAVDKQLGLKIEQQKHPVPMLVIDHCLRTPTEN